MQIQKRKSETIYRGEEIEVECTLELTGQRQFLDISKENVKD